MKKWTKNAPEKIANEIKNGNFGESVLANQNFVNCRIWLRHILDIIIFNHLEKMIDFERIIKRACHKSPPQPFEYIEEDLEGFLKEVSKELQNGFIRPSFRFPQIPPKQKTFTIKEVAEITGRQEKTIRNNIDSGELIAEKEGRHRFIQRKNLLKYKRKLKK